jgi:predicted DNA-binding protein YlxM (UPF0122 family)
MRCEECGLEFMPPDWQHRATPIPAEFWEFLQQVVRVAAHRLVFCTPHLVTYEGLSQLGHVKSHEEWAESLRHWVRWEEIYRDWRAYRIGQAQRRSFTVEKCLTYLPDEFDRQTSDPRLKSADRYKAEALAAAICDCVASVPREYVPDKELPDKALDLTQYFAEAKLSPRQMHIAEMHFERGMSVAKIAKHLAKHRSTIQESLGRIKRRLAQSSDFQAALKDMAKNQ